MKRYQIAIPTLFLAILQGCGPAQIVDAPTALQTPSWVQSRPRVQGHYVGIGSARKTTDINLYQQNAKQNALADLASEISVNISSNSVLHAVEVNLKLKEDFTSTIQAQTQHDLEGFDLVQTWEDQQTYYVYYQLSKSDYQRILSERETKATIKALDYYTKSIENITIGDTRSAIANLIKALEPIKPYFSDPLDAEHNGKRIFLGNEIIGLLSQTISSVGIVGSKNQISAKVGQGILPEMLTFRVVDARGRPVNGILVNASYTEKPLRNSRARSDINGEVSFMVDIVRSNRPYESLKSTVNLEEIIHEATTDPLIRKLVSRFSTPEAVVTISIVKPVFHISGSEVNLGSNLPMKPIAESLKRKILAAGLSVSDNEIDADYRVRIDASTTQKGESGGFKHSSLSCTIAIKDSNGADVYLKNLDGTTGAHNDFELAGKEAYKEAVKRLESTIAPEIVEGLVKGRIGY